MPVSFLYIYPPPVPLFIQYELYIHSHFCILCQNHVALYHSSSFAEPEFVIASKLSLALLRFLLSHNFIQGPPVLVIELK
jgi:hypothetical protein